MKKKLVPILLILAVSPMYGCSSTTTTTEVRRTADPVPVDSEYARNNTVETSTTTTSESSSCGGILSCTVDGVGYIIALPFKIVGGLIDIIF